MAARIRAIIERIKQEPGWLLVLLGVVTIYLTYRLYQHFAGGSATGGYVPTNGLDVPLYPSSVGGTPGNLGASPVSGPGGIGTSYGQQLQDLLAALDGGGTVPTFPGVGVSGGTSHAGGTTTTHAVSSGGASAPGGGNLISGIIGSVVSTAQTIATQAQQATPAKSSPAPQPSTTSPAASVGDNPAQWAQPQPASTPVGQSIGAALGGASFTVPAPSTSNHMATHSDNLGY